LSSTGAADLDGEPRALDQRAGGVARRKEAVGSALKRDEGAAQRRRDP
jgi:hypothetical protein